MRKQAFRVVITVEPATKKFCNSKYSRKCCQFYDNDPRDQMDACGHCALFGEPIHSIIVPGDVRVVRSPSCLAAGKDESMRVFRSMEEFERFAPPKPKGLPDPFATDDPEEIGKRLAAKTKKKMAKFFCKK